MHGKISPTYHTWTGMKDRCGNRKNKRFHRYGARGISVCDRWESFENFLADMGEKPPGMSLDRIDNNGNYCPENCRWATGKQQARNKSNNTLMTHAGKTQTMQEWSEELGITSSTISWRLQRGWSDEQCLLGRPQKNGRFITYSGTTKNIMDWCTELKLNYTTVHRRFEKGWSDAECLLGRRDHTS